MKIDNSFLIRQLIWNYVLILISLIITSFLCCLSKYTNCLFAFLAYIPFPMLFMYFNKFIIDSLLNLGKTKHKKCEIVTIAIFMHIAKYILIILPIIIGVVINIISDSEIFNLFSLIISALIYPTSSLLSQINLYNKRQND